MRARRGSKNTSSASPHIGSLWRSAPVGGIQQQQRRGRAEHAGQQRLRRIDRHGKVGTHIPHRPCRHHAPCVQIDHGDLARIGDVDIGAAGSRIDLECLRVRRQSDVRDLHASRRIDQRQPAIAVADHRNSIARIDPNVVGIITKRDTACRQKVLGTEKPNRAVPCIGDQNDIGAFRITHTLRLAQSADPMQKRARDDIDDVHGIVAQLGDHEPLARRIERQVIDPAAHSMERDGLLQDQRLRGMCRHNRQHDHSQPNRDPHKAPPDPVHHHVTSFASCPQANADLQKRVGDVDQTGFPFVHGSLIVVACRNSPQLTWHGGPGSTPGAASMRVVQSLLAPVPEMESPS